MKLFNNSPRLLSLAVVLLLGLSAVAFGQGETAATITGQVTDSTGGLIQNATVVMIKTDTNTERRVRTNDDGNYVITNLQPGTYSISVEHQGFKRYLQTLTLSAKDRRPVEIVLEAGSPSETVTISEETAVIQDSPTGQTLISGTQVIELPLVNRDYLKLAELVPGVSSSLDDESTFGLTSRADISINGMRRNAVNYLVDGVTNTDPGSNITLLSTPTVDSIKEFKVLTSNYTAEIGRSGGGVVTVVTRGGGNDFHGSLYEFFRNDRLNANTFFNNRQARLANGAVNPIFKTPKLRYNNFGGTISGPVMLPLFGEGGPRYWSGRNKTFFFFSEEVRRIIRGTTAATRTVPNAFDRIGDFGPRLGNLVCRNAAGSTTATASAAGVCPEAQPLVATAIDTNGQLIQVRVNQIFRFGTSTAYANNRVPSSEFDLRAVSLLDAFPLPNSGTNSFIFSPISLNNTRQETVRIDHNFNDNNRLFGRYTHDLSQTQESQGLFGDASVNLPGVSTTNTRVPGHVLAVSMTSILSPRIVNEATYNFSGTLIGSTPSGRSRRSDYTGADTIPERFPENNFNAIPTINISTFGGIAYGHQGFRILTRIHAVRDVLTWTRGNHTFKFGGEFSHEQKAENANNLSQGGFAFSGNQTAGPTALGGTARTGLGAASFLLGVANTYSEDERDVTFDFRFGRREFFAQDTWKIRPNLTLDYGVRYQYFTPVRDVDNILTNFDPRRYVRANAPTCTAATPLTCATIVPGTGDPLNGIVVAGRNSSNGSFIAPRDLNNFSPRVGLAWDPFSKGKTVVRLGYGFYFDQPLSGVFGQNVQVNPPFNRRVGFTTSGSTVITLSNPTGGQVNAIAPPALQGTDPEFQLPETQQWSLGVQHQVFKNATIDLSYVGTKGDNLIRITDINWPTPQQVIAAGGTATVNVINAARPFRGYTSITYRESSGKSRYHGMLSSFVYRFTTGSSVTVAYTWSKNLVNATNDRDAVDTPQHYSLKDFGEYAVARSNRAHVFSASYVYELPWFKKSDNGLLRHALGGWQISGITQIQSGLPVARVLNLSGVQFGNAATNSGLRGNRPNLISDPNAGLAGTLDSNGLPFIFDPTAFGLPPDGTFGNSPRAFARLPTQNQTNLSAIKNIYFNKDRDFRLQFRAESFNIFNHTQFTAVGVVFDPTLALTATTLGRPTSARLPRELQFGLKLYF
ncbi:MAG: TonB-dependent receptor domain-containing protein [Pyrinomonadaceae bacterium]